MCQSGTELSIVPLFNVIFPDGYQNWIVSGTDFCADLLHNPLLGIAQYVWVEESTQKIEEVNSDLPVQGQHGDTFLQENKETPDFRT